MSKSKSIVILGGQWGDEGKGKVVDLLVATKCIKYVVRYQGGDNAGHTFYINSKKIVSHIVPSGIFHNHIINIIANGVVLSPFSLVQEINVLRSEGVNVDGRILISESCPMILPYHVAMDRAREKFAGVHAIGTTGCGIGPAYEDKVARRALRIVDLFDKKQFANKLRKVVDYYNFQLLHYYDVDVIDCEIVLSKILSIADYLLSMAVDTSDLLYSARQRGDVIVFEGAQGALLDIDHGTYPYVTSSNTTLGAVFSGTGVILRDNDYILGVLKAYSTRVGAGPFPTELCDNIGARLCDYGNEFGSTTGRRRRVGWFDAVIVCRAVKVNFFSGLCLTKLDVLDGLEEVKVCVGYRLKNGKVIYCAPLDLNTWEAVEPVYEIFSGWLGARTFGVKKFSQLPEASRIYIRRIEEIINVPIDIISTGPSRYETIVIRHPLLLDC
ncbi:adenylosuccinate synthase [Blochmannia endosymbiont of Polyrhachis (Hedomyrma) turneri]|uniref:adenylosuccinate synthase n=1 Tax=Blochmannia endosymbiont of Polyrhachis (Hedomyrma) turneri TaxID=1505596 RepID=UPI00061A684E|nr:adenylosuccinate synthase [Blochmannia endosymbiont of Polyrhachis (Hedomyrma) turneri]AKC59669.1 Adenylosuccinate synthetase [Blochmannia endosymbiont of Polyrhachis (Hedomyrma) turneri]